MKIKMLRLTASSSRVELGRVTVWFSYETPIAFSSIDGMLVVRENDWGPTTGKHMNKIDGGQLMAKHRRVSGTVFTHRLEALLLA